MRSDGRRWWRAALVALVAVLAVADDGFAQRRGGGGGGGGRSSFGGGSRSSSSSGASRSYGGSSSASRPSTPSRPPAASSSSGSTARPGRTYGGSASASKPSPPTAPAPSAGSGLRPSAGSAATSAQQRGESRAAFRKSAAPRDTYRTASGEATPIDRGNPGLAAENARLRGQLDESRMQTRAARADAAYGRWRGVPPYGYYHDPFHLHFNNLFLTWILIDQARYLVRHEAMMDHARVDALYAQNAALRDEVARVRHDGVPADWKGPIEDDLAYTDDYIGAVAGYDPVEPADWSGPDTPAGVARAEPAGGGGGIGSFLMWSAVLIATGYLLYWAVFKYKF